MRWIDLYAIAASAATFVVTVFIVRVSRARGPSRGFGAAQAILVFGSAWLLVLIHGSIVSGIALATGRTPVAGAAAALHLLVILGGAVSMLRR